ncbi:heme ABC transporter substrate-binding protein IsdE [Cytobacillus purgationiresistens]|uniref:High-affinity heme uptake system protein IsdE n=1 Tax=Cytobacillus purgationiresistens TaxID=863449 RepID=A0ABU0AMP5_9BACI|nr:heme ABC transporter substrate-binding protein IsdE [Cytobacillus purgationiresistens]MDQ0272531.1 iron complex transport system substrate-binding protein [Cytobacillus purgationiresistens]
MSIIRVALIFVLILILGGCSGNSGQTVVPEKDGVATNEKEEDKRVIATTLAITEILDQLEVSLIGVPTTGFEIPKRYKDAIEVGNPMQPDMEVISTLGADKVLSVTTLEYDLKDSFKVAGVDAEFLNLQGVDDMVNTINELGEEFGREKQATELSGRIDKKIKEIEQQTSNYESPKVLILLGIPGSYLVATEHSYVGNLVETAGGTNAISGQAEEYISANTEYLHEADADIILRLSHGLPDEVAKMFNEEFKTNDIWKHFKAVKTERVYDLQEPRFATTANLHVIDALDELTKLLYEK